MTETPEGVVVTQELLPCPFCGAQAQWIEDNGEFDRPFGLVTEHTETCFMGGRMMAEWETIITAWNTRAHTPTLRGEEVERLRAELAWYGEQARLARLIHSGGDAGRHALSEDGGKRAIAALSQPLAVDTGQSGEVERLREALREAQAERDFVTHLVTKIGLYHEDEDEMIPLRIEDESDASVGLDGRWALHLPEGYSVIKLEAAR